MTEHRISPIGRRESLKVRILLREMRRAVVSAGTLPRIEWPDARLNRAWSDLGSIITDNARRSKRIGHG